MIKNIFFVMTFLFNMSSSLYSMDTFKQETADRFSIATDDLNVVFRRIHLPAISNPSNEGEKNDCETLKKHFGDFDAVKDMFGWPAAIVFQVLHKLSPKFILDTYINAYTAKLNKMSEDQKIEYHWFVEDSEKNFLGLLSISTYVGGRPVQYSDKFLLEVGLALSEEYRNQGITSKLLVPVLQKLSQCRQFKNGIFCFDTRADNEAVHKIAAKLGARLIYSHNVKRDFGLWEEGQLSHLFVIDLKS